MFRIRARRWAGLCTAGVLLFAAQAAGPDTEAQGLLGVAPAVPETSPYLMLFAGLVLIGAAVWHARAGRRED
jgi:hypothetical protein